MQAISSDDEASLLRHRLATTGVTTNAGDTLTIHKDFRHCEILAKFGPCCHSRVSQDFVKHNALGGVDCGKVTINRRGKASEREGAEVVEREIESNIGNRRVIRVFILAKHVTTPYLSV